MFATLFKRAEATVNSAIGDLGNRVLIAIPFLAAFGFGAASSHVLRHQDLWPRDRKSHRRWSILPRRLHHRSGRESA